MATELSRAVWWLLAADRSDCTCTAATGAVLNIVKKTAHAASTACDYLACSGLAGSPGLPGLFDIAERRHKHFLGLAVRGKGLCACVKILVLTWLLEETFELWSSIAHPI
jgi:hypothetical protein